ncbi:MAG: response regulator [Hyphomicrobium sp.]
MFDDHERIRGAIVAALERSQCITVTCQGGSADDVAAALTIDLPDVVVLDMHMPGDGLHAASHIRFNAPSVRTVMLTSSDDEHFISAALVAGAHDYIVKGQPASDIIAAILRVAAGQSYISPALAARLLARRGIASPWLPITPNESIVPLTEREEQLLRRLAQGLSDDEAGASVGLPARTVGMFATNILTKIHALALTGAI